MICIVFAFVKFVVRLVGTRSQPFWRAAATHDADGTRPWRARGTSDLIFPPAAPPLVLVGVRSGMKMRSGFSRDRGLLAARAMLWFFLLISTGCQRKAELQVPRIKITLQSFLLVVFSIAPVACRSLSVQISRHLLSPFVIVSFLGCG